MDVTRRRFLGGLGALTVVAAGCKATGGDTGTASPPAPGSTGPPGSTTTSAPGTTTTSAAPTTSAMTTTAPPTATTAAAPDYGHHLFGPGGAATIQVDAASAGRAIEPGTVGYGAMPLTLAPMQLFRARLT